MDHLDIYYSAVSRIYVILMTMISAYCFYRLIREFLDKKKHACMAGIAYFVTMMLAYYIPVYFNNMTAYGMGTCAGFAVMYLLDKRNVEQKIYLTVTFFSCRWLSLAMANSVYCILFQYTNNCISGNGMIWFLVYAGLTALDTVLGFAFMFLAVNMVEKAYVYKDAGLTGKELIMLAAPSVSGVIGYGMLQYYSAVLEAETGESLFDLHGSYHILCFLNYSMSFAAILVMTLVFQNLKGRREEENRNRILLGQIEDMKRYTREVEKRYHDIRSLKHDMGNHIMILENLYQKNEQEEAARYTVRIREQLDEKEAEIKSGNPVTDVILMEKKRELKERGITFVCGFKYPPAEGLDVFDVSVILNNAINNAIEAAEKCDDPCIYVSSYRKRNAYMIEVKNCFAGKLVLERESGLPVTTKEPAEGHGYGLYNIRKVAQKYFGDIDIRQEGGCFVLSVMLML